MCALLQPPLPRANSRYTYISADYTEEIAGYELRVGGVVIYSKNTELLRREIEGTIANCSEALLLSQTDSWIEDNRCRYSGLHSCTVSFKSSDSNAAKCRLLVPPTVRFVWETGSAYKSAFFRTSNWPIRPKYLLFG